MKLALCFIAINLSIISGYFSIRQVSSDSKKMFHIFGLGDQHCRSNCRLPYRKLCYTKRMKLADSTDAKPKESVFDWSNQWYPIAPIQDLDMLTPNHAQLLGIDLVVWFHSPSETWQVFRDSCPHRLAPLSEGRIDANGNLQASEP
jgi:hypothetical protein